MVASSSEGCGRGGAVPQELFPQGKQPATLQAPQAVMRPGSPLWPLDTLVCTEEEKLEFQCSKTRVLLRTQRLRTEQRQHGRSSRASSGLPGGRPLRTKPGRRAREGRKPPETDVLFWPLVTPVKPPTEFTADPERS